MPVFLNRCILILLLTLVSTSSFSQIYKWKDSRGQWQYSDIPPAGNVKSEQLDSHIKTKPQEPSAEKLPETTAKKVDKPADAKTPAAIKLEKDQAKKDKEKQAAIEKERLAIKAENCKISQSNLAVYKNGGRIKTANDQGELVYLNDAEMASSRVEAQQKVDQYCN